MSPRRPRPEGRGALGGALAAAGATAALAVLLLVSGCAATRPRGEEPAAPAANGAVGRPGAPGGAPGAIPIPGGPPAPPPVSDAWKAARSVRIGLAVGAPKLLLAGSKDWTLGVEGGGSVAAAKAGAVLQIVRMGAGVVEVYRAGQMAPLWTGGPRDTLLLEPGDGAYAGFSNAWYRGAFRIYASQPEGLTLVNEVDLESYLRGVLPQEIGHPPDTDYEAVKAQAVAARSYTLSYLGRRADLGFDLWATVEDQVYGGTARENPQSDRALRETRGEILLCEGVPIRALYSSACGGRTANVEDVWPWPWTPYLRSVRDNDGDAGIPYCAIAANFRWREEWDAESFLAMLRKFGPPEGGAAAVFAGDLLDVRVGARSRCGRVSDLDVTTTRGDFTIGGDRVRWALRRPGGDAILRSSFFKIGVVRRQDGLPFMVVASGAGNGHGIGMCQWGAMGMARAGKGYRDILRHYYKATQIAHL